MNCRSGCGACCVVPSITSPIPGMPDGNAAGVPCVQLDAGLRCKLFGEPTRPQECSALRPAADMCGVDPVAAFVRLRRLEIATRPGDADRD